MIVRRYVVKDMPEAVVLIRKDLGKDAVILSSKRIRVKKWLGLWHTKRIEVLAATGDDIPTRVMDTRVGSAATVTETQVMPIPGADRMSRTLNGTPQVTNERVAQPRQQGEWERLKREVEELRTIVQSNLAVAAAVQPNRHLSETALLERLLEQGVQPSVAKDIVADGEGCVEAVDVVLNHLADFAQPQPIHPESRICAFIGPTGVGKTTTIAKLAALHVLTGTRKVGLMTTDTYRIAAVEQLRTYANILHVPLEVVQSGSDFEFALERLSECDLILIDTAGRSYRDDSHVEDIRDLLVQAHVDETFLVMSMTSKPDDLFDLAASFSRIDYDKFLFTKLDETSSLGPALTLLHEYRKPLSYVTTGQNVPDDIEIASLDKLVRFIVEGANRIA